ncbi:methyl-accepting chemotaxis protein [Oribacterium sinus]|uniref:methyl-accepting chemotaxis protein n=1 Tax=Oribacterium sinus TaxID=237576 RepID=UPI0028D10F5F|nr:methyl-accepting chemotaxis protein [Oribacterium sinus]
MKSLRNTLILSILLPILVVFILLGFVFMQFMEKKSTREGDAAMESSAVQMGSAVDTILSEIETRIGVIELAVTDIPDQNRIQAKDLDYFKSFEGNMNNLLVDGTKDIPGLVASYVRYDPALTYGTSGTFYTDTDGDGKLEAVTPTDLAAYEPTDTEHVGWFYTPLANKKATWMEPYFNANISKTIISYVVPFYLKNGDNYGVTGVDFDFAYLDDLLKKNQKYEGDSSFLINAEGKILYHAQYQNGENFQEIEDGKYADAFKEMQDKDHGFVHEGSGKSSILMGFTTLENGWKIVAVPSYHEIYGSLESFKLTFTVFSVLFAAFMLVLAVLVGNRIAHPIVKLSKSVERMSQGALDEKITVKDQTEIGALAHSLESLGEQLKNYKLYIGEISQVLNQMSEGELSISLQHEYNGEFACIKAALNALSGKLTDLIGNIQTSSERVSEFAGNVANSAQSLSQGSIEQAGSIEQLSERIRAISDHVEKSAENTKLANAEAHSTQGEVEKADQQMQKMQKAMEEISDKSGEISKIIKTIDDIAFQTNILALNAAIEAARAGSYGKGFAVVADEVGNLAQKSADAAKDTTTLIEETVRAVEEGAKLAEHTAVSLQHVVKGSGQVNDLVNEIAKATEEQAKAVSDVREGISSISDVVQRNTATAEESGAASEELNQEAKALEKQVAEFKI